MDNVVRCNLMLKSIRVLCFQSVSACLRFITFHEYSVYYFVSMALTLCQILSSCAIHRRPKRLSGSFTMTDNRNTNNPWLQISGDLTPCDLILL